MSNQLTDSQWEEVCLVACKSIARDYLLKGFWIGVLAGYLFGAGVTLLSGMF